jgi:hypothetical protein
LSQLSSLEELRVLAPEGRSIDVALRALANLPGLRSIALHGVHPLEGPRIFSSGFAALEHLEYTPSDERAADRVPTRPSIVQRDDGMFLVWVALPELLGVEDSEEAVDRMQQLLVEERPDWARALTLVPETESALVIAPSRRVLESLLDWLEARFGLVA